MNNINVVLTDQQMEAMRRLQDQITIEVVFGGGAGGGKTKLGCIFAVSMCQAFPGSRGVIGRRVLKLLKQTTLLTFFEVTKEWGLRAGEDFVYNKSDDTIIFKNGSLIFLKDLAYDPSDPEYERLGSLEVTWAFIDEAGEVDEKAKNTVLSRIRYKLAQFGIAPKLLMTCNPTKNFIYATFYKPFVEGVLNPDRAFIQALARDNPFVDPSYIATLQRLDKTSKERLLNGNWEHDDDPNSLIEYDAILDLFTTHFKKPEADSRGVAYTEERPYVPERWLTCDVARFGKDKTVIYIWEDFEIIKIDWAIGQSTRTTSDKIIAYEKEHAIPRSRVIVDEDGVGGGVLDNLPGAKGFVANAKPQGGENYQNLKTQCHYRLAEKVNTRGIGIREERPEVKRFIVEELEQVKRKNPDTDGKLMIVSKDHVKSMIGRSPDFSDALAMRMWRPPQIGFLSSSK